MYERLTADDIYDLHEVALERYNGRPGVHEPGMIEFMAEAPFQEYFGEDVYPGDVFVKAAIYMWGLAAAQYFVDGNKRTSVLCATAFLFNNGYLLTVNDDTLYFVALAVACKAMSRESLARFLRRHSQILMYDE